MNRGSEIRALRRVAKGSGIALIALSGLFMGPVAAAEAKPHLSDVAEVENILFAAAIAHEVSEKCPNLSARRMKAIAMAWQLRSRANDLGYSDAEIRAYVESDVEKSRMRSKGESFLKQNGVSYSDPETFCAFGRAEIAKSSAIGALLKAR
jgi:hypothetical protein